MEGKLFEPIKIGTIEVRNRMVMPAMFTAYGDSSGFVTQRQIDYYVERAKNDVGLIITEAIPVVPGGRHAGKKLGIHDDVFIAGLSKLAKAIRSTGACCFLQLNHGGRRAPSSLNNGLQPVAPSAIPFRSSEMPRELTIKEIDNIIEAFAEGARRAKEASFDGIEVLCGHGLLLAQFLSPLTNKRNDEYGGCLESRAKFAVEIIQRIRQRVGESYPIIARINGDEHIKGGLNIGDAKRVAVMLEKAGADAINVTAGYGASHEEGYLNCRFPSSVTPMSIPHGEYLHLAEEIKKVVKVPVIAVGRLDDPSLAEEVVARNRADLVAVGRGLIADAAFACKVYHKQYDDIRRCIGCCECITTTYEGNMRCTVNPEVGKEKEYQLRHASKRKHVLVVGGGPAGMEAARIASLRGHKVTLVEKRPYLGGNMIAASAASFKRDISLFAEYLSTAIQKLGVSIILNTDVDQEKLLALKPDAVILATGALPHFPAIPGIERSSVTDAVKVLGERAHTDSKVVVAGAGSVGCEVAAFLAESGKEVTMVEMRDTDFSDTGGLAPDMNPLLRRWLLFELWPNLPIEVIGKSIFKEVTDSGLVVEDREGKQKLVPGNTIVFAAGMKPNSGLKEEVQGKVPELYEVGDCIKPRRIIDAVDEAARVARII